MQTKLRLKDYVQLGESGLAKDVDQLMAYLHEKTTLLTIKMVDNALNLVNTREGKICLRYYLYHGTEIQRNYAALFFKRRDDLETVEAAFAAGKLDERQAYVK